MGRHRAAERQVHGGGAARPTHRHPHPHSDLTGWVQRPSGERTILAACPTLALAQLVGSCLMLMVISSSGATQNMQLGWSHRESGVRAGDCGGQHLPGWQGDQSHPPVPEPRPALLPQEHH